MQVSFRVYQQQIAGTQTECCDGYRMSDSTCIRKISIINTNEVCVCVCVGGGGRRRRRGMSERLYIHS